MMNTKLKPQAAPALADPQEETSRVLYMESLHLVERLHRRLLDVTKDEFDRQSFNFKVNQSLPARPFGAPRPKARGETRRKARQRDRASAARGG